VPRREEDSVTATTTYPESALRRAVERDWWVDRRGSEYERQREVHAPGSRRRGAATVTASKSIEATVDRLYDAFVDPEVRRRWLPNVAMQPSALLPARSARFEWADGSERVNVTFTATDDATGRIAVEHSRLQSEPAAAAAKAFWRARLTDLKGLLEA
jgi:hypothetical protein